MVLPPLMCRNFYHAVLKKKTVSVTPQFFSEHGLRILTGTSSCTTTVDSLYHKLIYQKNEKHCKQNLHLCQSNIRLISGQLKLLPRATVTTGCLSCSHILQQPKVNNSHSNIDRITLPIRSYSVQTNPKHQKHNRQTCIEWNKLSFSFASIIDASPDKYKPYLSLMRLHQPIGIWLVFFPSAWSLAMASESGALPDISLITKFFAGAFLMRGAACVINDILDKDYDKQVNRTQHRPLACGDLTVREAVKFLAIPLTGALAILLTFDNYSILLGTAAMLPTVLYPVMKRYTHWPQLFLGMTLNWGVLLGWSVVNHGTMDWSVVLPLYTACIMWTMIYDTIYAHQDKLDDALIGVKSLALLLEEKSQVYLQGFSAVMGASLMLAGYNADQTLIYYVGALAFYARLSYLLSNTCMDSETDCGETFRACKWLGVLMFFTIVLSNWAKEKKSKQVS